MKTASQRPPSVVDSLPLRALAGVQRSAQNGELPLFAWTLGLPKTALMALLAEQHTEQIIHLHRLTDEQCNRLRVHAPASFEPLAELIKQHRSASIDETQAQWLARVLAAGCFGERHLWKELGFNCRDDLSQLLERYFQPLYLRNHNNLRWKRLLFSELGLSLGDTTLRPPGCNRCEQFSTCFADIKANNL